MKLLLLAWKNSNHIDYLKYISDEHILYTLDDESEIFPNEIEALIARPGTHIQQEVLEQYQNITHIFVTWAGTNHIDKEYCGNHGIQIINRPGSNARGVSDLAVWWILSHLRKWFQAHHALTQWIIESRQKYCTRSLCELHYGFIWFGRISRTVRVTLQGFDATQASYYDPFLSGSQSGVQPGTLEEIAKTDCIIVWAPHTPDTHEMVNASVFEHLPKNAIIINVARGGLVNETDLLAFLEKRPDCSYYTDVRQWEPTITEIMKKLLMLPNYLATPHTAAETHESQSKMHYFEVLA
jgi:D-3-phosphoglycerate dehydrogenase